MKIERFVCYPQTRDFHKLKNVIQQLAQHEEFGSNFQMSDASWNKLDDIITVLGVPYTATQNMQRNGYGLTDFYISWLRMNRSLTRHVNSQIQLAKHLMDELKRRESVLLDTPTILAAIYLDPRVKYKLDDTQKECAVLSLEKLYIRKSNSLTEDMAYQQSNDTLDELNADAAHECLGDANNNPTEMNVFLKPFRDCLAHYDSVLPGNIKSNVMVFWEANKGKFPLLYELACIIHAVQAGQCCVERNFSAFSYIYNCRRTKLLPNNISNIMMINLNKDVHEIWQKGEIDKIRKSRHTHTHT